MSPKFKNATFGFFNFALFSPKGSIAFSERNILIIVVLLALVAVVPAYILLFIFSRKYKVDKFRNGAAQDNQSTKWVALFWLLPIAVVFTISAVTWNTTHALDPYKPITSDNQPITIQVIALPWKWLFIYPEQRIATVNYIQIPINTPIHFQLTADNAPMSAFWIPELGSQMFAMTGMSSKLNLIATQTGDFQGESTEINGAGFSGMKFITHSSSQQDFNQWVRSLQQSPNALTQDAYTALVKPSEYNSPAFYSLPDENMYNEIIAKYMSQSINAE